MAPDMTIDELRSFVWESKWTFARTMPQIPHEYTFRRDAKDEALFKRVVIHIREVGHQEKWGAITYTYLNIDGWQYWTMGAPLDQTILINGAAILGE